MQFENRVYKTMMSYLITLEGSDDVGGGRSRRLHGNLGVLQAERQSLSKATGDMMRRNQARVQGRADRMRHGEARYVSSRARGGWSVHGMWL